MAKRIIDLSETDSIESTDYLMVDSKSGGSRKILASSIGGDGGGGSGGASVEIIFADEVFTCASGIDFPRKEGLYSNWFYTPSRGGGFVILDERVLLYDFGFVVTGAALDRDSYWWSVFSVNDLFYEKIGDFLGNRDLNLSPESLGANFFDPYSAMYPVNDSPDEYQPLSAPNRLKFDSSTKMFRMTNKAGTPTGAIYRYKGMMLKPTLTE